MYVLSRIAPSKIHGVGVFALRDIPKGTKLNADMMSKLYTLPIEFFTHLRPEVQKIIIERWPNVYNGSRFIYPDTRIQAFMNHSEKPNYSATNDVTLGDIKVGEEITENYKDIENWQKAFPWLDK